MQKTSIALSRAGAGFVSNFIEYRIPSILMPLPSAKDNHQFHNANILCKNDVAIIVDQDISELQNIKNYIYKIYNDKMSKKLINEKFAKFEIKNSNYLIYKIITNEE